MAVTWNENLVPSELDPWNLVTDMRRLAEASNRVIPVYSKSQRDQLAASAPNGVVPDGTVVVRMDLSQRGAVMDVFMNGTWMEGDTGVRTTGVNIQASGVAKVESYSLRRRGTRVTARIDLTYTGPELTGDSVTGNIADTTLFTIEAAWQPVWATYDVTWSNPGTSTYFGRINTGGVAAVTSLLPGGKLPKDSPVRLDGSWDVL